MTYSSKSTPLFWSNLYDYCYTTQGGLRNVWVRLQRRIAQERFQRFGIFSPTLLGYGASAMLTAARQARADLTTMHSEVGLWVRNQLLNQGFHVGVDFEDWFSEDLLPEACAAQPVAHLQALEQRPGRDCTYCLQLLMLSGSAS